MMTPAELNALPSGQFIAALAGIFEQSPWVAERVMAARPFGSRKQLHAAMCQVVAQAAATEQLALIRAHPRLKARVSVNDALTDLSLREQRGAGLEHCTAVEVARLADLNARYYAKFGFPFVLAVRGHHPGSIFAELERRLSNEVGEEHANALRQIGAIALYRLTDVMTD